VLSSNDAVRLQEIPKSIIIIGAGVIGVEFASILRELGAEVTVLEIMPRALSTEDEAIAELLLREFKKRKIAVRTGVRVSSVSAGDAGVVVTLDSGDRLEAEQLLISIGRAFNTEDLGLEALGIKRGQRGEIAVDDRMETSVGGVYAVGDVTGGMLLAHKASREGVAAAMNACGFDARMRYDVIPAAIFTMPEIGSVGLREHQARERGIAVRIGTFPYRGLGKAHAMGEIAGLFKIIADATTDKVLGVHIIGSHASDIVHEGALAMLRGLTSGELAGLVHAHPTLSEGLQEAAEAVHGRAIHLPKP
jgi:dihydrolipoamide dehydrogenase